LNVPAPTAHVALPEGFRDADYNLPFHGSRNSVLRRRFLHSLAAAAWTGAASARHVDDAEHVRIGLTPVFLDDQVAFLEVWRDYLEAGLRRPVTFVQRGSYREIVDLLRGQQLEFAWVCGFPFVRFRRDMRLLAVPLYHGRPLYQSYLIVPAEDTTTRSILDLRGKTFAFSDPDSNSGFLFPNYRLLELRERPNAFFSKSFFTWAHRKVVDAVASRLAQGGAVDGYVWETLRRFHPDVVGRTRVVEKSPEFGFPPFVAHPAVASREFAAAQRALIDMSGNDQGRRLLRQLNLDGFTAGDESLFSGIESMSRAVLGNVNGPPA
jgi:phosphate/phosphite/phosphonate ABC transporter binding protein